MRSLENKLLVSSQGRDAITIHQARATGNRLITELFFATEDVVAAGRLADAVDANIVRVRAAAGAIDYLILEQVVSA